MIVVCDMGPLHYLVLIGAEEILPQLYTRVLTPPAVITEMSHLDTPEPVRLWAASPPKWLEVREPAEIEDIPSLGRKGLTGAGEKAAIALAREQHAHAILMDDKTAQREAQKRGLHQGQRPLKRCSSKDFQQVVIVPTTTAAFQDETCAVGMLLQE